PPLRFPGTDPSAVEKPPVIAPDPRPEPPPPAAEPGWATAFESRPLGADDPSAFWDPPVVATAPPGRFEELVAAAAKAEAESAGAEPAGPASQPPPSGQLREISRDRPLTSDPTSGEWAVASGLGGNVGPSPGAGRRVGAPSPGLASPQSDWDRLTGPRSGRRPVGEGEAGSWEFFDESGTGAEPSPAPAPAAPAPAPEGQSTMALPHWTDPPTGEVPRILGDAPPPPAAPPAADDELSAWSALSTGPRWRDQPADWEGADFSDTVLDDREARLGALRDQPEAGAEGDLFAFDDAPVAAPPPPPVTGARGARGTATQTRPAARRGRPGAPGPDGPSGDPMGLGGPGGGGGSGTDLSTRVVTGVIAAGVLLAATAIGSTALVLLVAAAVTMAGAEMFQALRTRGYQPATLLGLVGCASMVLAAYNYGLVAFPLVLTLMVIFSFLWYLAGVVHAKPTMNIAVTLFAFLYVGFLGSFAAVLLGYPDELGVGILLGAVIVTAAHDIGAYLVGRFWGKTPLAPELSPNKTFEGLVGGVLASVFVALLIVSRIGPWDAGKAFWLGVVVAIAAPLGDLCESMIKRDLGVKDMGKLLPGHGGVLDRIDALLFVIPATFYLTVLLDIPY
ncbi:MAG TPA: phosphatidate cytidylyltransferase, partial [Acidimicrobiales bacterium]|nr:phosphatidate cytidylyltransferase [Acidimicrobiales bacterium]